MVFSGEGINARKIPFPSHRACQRWWNESRDVSRANRCRQTCMRHIVESCECLALARKWWQICWTQPFIYMINSWIVILALAFLPLSLGGAVALTVILISLCLYLRVSFRWPTERLMLILLHVTKERHLPPPGLVFLHIRNRVCDTKTAI